MTSENEHALVASPPAPTDEQIEQIRRAGSLAISQTREIQRIQKQIAGLTWGSGDYLVQGKNLSPSTQAAFAEFCAITGANAMMHLHILGGMPYLNAAYWSDKINRDPFFLRHYQRDLSPHTEAALRRRAAEFVKAAEQTEDATKKAEYMIAAIAREEEAADIALARASWGPPEYATHIVETVITRFINIAPIDKIRSGEIPVEDLEKWTRQVPECNWAGGMGQNLASAKKFDPVGDAFPALTSRTRSIKRCSCSAFSAWGAEYEERIERAQSALQAEWQIVGPANAEIIQSEPVPDEPPTVSTGGGEPQAGTPGEPQETLPLPTEGAPAAEEPEVETAEEETEANEPEFDKDDWRKRLFATLRDAGHGDEAKRKAWAEANGFPKSTKAWEPDDYVRAVELLVAPERAKYQTGCIALGLDPDQFAHDVLDALPDTLRDYLNLNVAVNARADKAAADA